MALKSERASIAQLRRAAGSDSLDKLKQALLGWTATEIDADSSAKSALHMAAWKGSLDNIKFLIESVGCDVNAYSKGEFSYGKTAIFFAATRSRSEIVEYLLSQNAKVSIVNNKGQSVLSIAASHEMPTSLLKNIQQMEEEEAENWWNFRASHSDGFEYGDLDPRFLDRPLRDTDVVTAISVNPTTKETRRGGFSRRNPDAARELQTKQKVKTKKKKEKEVDDFNLTEEETRELENSWNIINSCSRENSTLQDKKLALLKIVQLGDKQRRAWIPKTALKLEEILGKEEKEKLVCEAISNSSKQDRLCELLKKLLLSVDGKTAKLVQSNSVPDYIKEKEMPSLTSEPWRSACRNVQSLSISLLENVSQCSSFLSLPQSPTFIDDFSQLQALNQHLLEHPSLLIAIDTEWYDQGENSLAISTLQISFLDKGMITDSRIMGGLSTYVVDLVIKNDKNYCQLAREMVRWILESKESIVLGFSLRNDLPFLQRFVAEDNEKQITTYGILDLQLLFATSSSSLPSLKACVHQFSTNFCLSKKQQCSDWEKRPLSREQLDYAGLDAAVLLVLLAEYSKANISKLERQRK